MSDFSDKLYEIVKEENIHCIFIDDDDDTTGVILHGKPIDLIYMLHKAYWCLRDQIAKDTNEETANSMMKVVTMPIEKIQEENKKMEQKIPSWLRKLMDLEKELTNDSADEVSEKGTTEGRASDRLECTHNSANFRGHISFDFDNDDSIPFES